MIGQYLPNNNENATVPILQKILHLNRALILPCSCVLVLGHSSIPASNAGEMEQNRRESREPGVALRPWSFHFMARRQAAKQILNLFYGVTVTIKSIQRRGQAMERTRVLYTPMLISTVLSRHR
jgi:hypothetical protein